MDACIDDYFMVCRIITTEEMRKKTPTQEILTKDLIPREAFGIRRVDFVKTDGS